MTIARAGVAMSIVTTGDVGAAVSTAGAMAVVAASTVARSDGTG